MRGIPLLTALLVAVLVPCVVSKKILPWANLARALKNERRDHHSFRHNIWRQEDAAKRDQLDPREQLNNGLAASVVAAAASDYAVPAAVNGGYAVREPHLDGFLTNGQKYGAQFGGKEVGSLGEDEHPQKLPSLEKIEEFLGQAKHVNGITKDGEKKKSEAELTPQTITMDMPGVKPSEPDTYLCVAVKLPSKDHFIVKYEPKAKQQIAHHMLLYGCSEPYQDDGKPWSCREMAPVCQVATKQTIMYAWAKNAPSLEMPENTGIHIGGSSNINWAVLQVHYADVSSFKNGKTDTSGVKVTISPEPKDYYANILLLVSGQSIPAHKKAFHTDIGCTYPEGQPTIYPFRFRTHTHKLGVVVTAYRDRFNKETGKWEKTEIGRGDPQRPQAFYEVTNKIDVKPGDHLIGRCTYNSMSRTETTYMGPLHTDEMCNFYMMFRYNHHEGTVETDDCSWLNMRDKTKEWTQFPDESDIPLSKAEKMHPRPGVVEVKQETKVEKVDAKVEKVEAKVETAADAGTKEESKDKAKKMSFSLMTSWPEDGLDTGSLALTVGQISGVDVIPRTKQVVVFQRGDTFWNGSTFDEKHVLLNKRTIKDNVLVWMRISDGAIVNAQGRNEFYLPHGITIDKQENLWLTDVGSHQVYKYSKDMKLLLSLGTKLQPGDGLNQFCKPTDVAVMKDGSFFVSDGYCNSRVLKFSKDGKVIGQITNSELGTAKLLPAYFNVVHSLTLDEKNSRLFVADRENLRVLVFHPETLAFKFKIDFKHTKKKPFAMVYCDDDGGLLHTLLVDDWANGLGVTYHLSSDSIISTWKPEKGFSGMVHDLALHHEEDGTRHLFVAQLASYGYEGKLWKFSRNR